MRKKQRSLAGSSSVSSALRNLFRSLSASIYPLEVAFIFHSFNKENNKHTCRALTMHAQLLRLWQTIFRRNPLFTRLLSRISFLLGRQLECAFMGIFWNQLPNSKKELRIGNGKSPKECLRQHQGVSQRFDYHGHIFVCFIPF